MSSTPQSKTALAVPRRARNDPRKEATRAALIDKAEAMFAEAGINGVSLRQIGAAIGSANANVVGYHFGNKEALLEAILLKHRLPIERRRTELLAKAEAEGRAGELPVLLHVLSRPIFEKTNAQGLHTYSAFLGSINRSSYYERRQALDASFPTTQDVVNRIAALVPRMPDKLFRYRIRVCGDLMTGVLQWIDFEREDAATAEMIFADALRQSEAVLTAPLGDAGLIANAGPDVSPGVVCI
jgi:AcrR family transcriptional regulator